MTARVVVCGVAALGSTAVHYCRNLEVELRLVDFDRVESKNLAAQWFVKQSVGKNKAEAIRLQLANFYGANAEAFGCGSRRPMPHSCSPAARSRSTASTTPIAGSHCPTPRAPPACRWSTPRSPAMGRSGSSAGTFGIVRWDVRHRPLGRSVRRRPRGRRRAGDL
jgi:hypothetical protein